MLGKLNARTSGSIEFQKSASVATTSHEARPFNRQKFVSKYPNRILGGQHALLAAKPIPFDPTMPTKFKFKGYIGKNPGSGRQPYSKIIWHTRHAGKNYRICLRTVASHWINTLHWMSLPWCLKNCSLEVPKHPCNQFIWQKNFGHCRNYWEQYKNWNWTNQRTNVGWLRRYSSTCPPTLQPKFYNCTMMCFHMAISLRAGDGLCSQCWRNTARRQWSQTFGPLLLYDCCTKFLLTWYCTEYSRAWTAGSPRNSMVSVLDDVWKNICSPQIWSWTKLWRQTFRCGYWA